MLDETPISLSDIIESSLAQGNTKGALDTNIKKLDEASGTSHEKSEEADSKAKKFTIQETLSARNIRVAVVGNVDAGKYRP